MLQDIYGFHIREQVTFILWRIVPAGSQAVRKVQMRADCLQSYRRDFMLAVVNQ